MIPQALGQLQVSSVSATTAPLARPQAIELDRVGRQLFVADTGNGVVRCVDQATAVMKVLVGNPDSTTPPSATPMSATAVSLLRPAGLAFDATAGELFVSDQGRQQLLRLQIRSSGNQIAEIVGAADLANPTSLALHAFTGGPRLLFALDRGGEGTGAGPVPRPALRVVDLDTLQRTTIDPGFQFRILYDLALRPLSSGAVELVVVADVGENFEELSSPPNINTTFRFETDLYDGLDGDGDGLIDSLDPDFREPLKVRVLRFTIPSTGLSVTNGNPIALTPTVLVRGHKKFNVSRIIFDPGCGGSTPGTQSVIDLPDMIAQAVAVDDAGRVYLVNSFDSTALMIEFNQANNITRTTIVAGIDSEVAPPYDGNDPRLTRLNRPLDLLFDELTNLYLADTVNNRVRRAWLGDILRSN